jgi:hypothetical protein
MPRATGFSITGRKEIYVYYMCAVLLCAAYAYLTFSVPPTSSAQLHISTTGTQLLRGSFVILYGVTLLLGIRCIAATWDYARVMRSQDETKAKGITRIGHGLLFLIAGLGVALTLGALRNLVAPTGVPITPTWQMITVMTNYVYIIFPAAGLWTIVAGARLAANETTGIVFSNKAVKDDAIVAIIFSLMITFLYGFLTFTNPTRQLSADLLIRPTYVISDSMILLTLIIPSFFVWVLGILAAFQLDRIVVEKTTAGFRSARRKLVNGLWEVIFSSILVEALLSLGGGRLIHLGLFFILFSVYGYFILLIVGYFTIMRGAQKLLSLSLSSPR